jgi:cell division protein YceG involved in septum cleavage
MEVKYMHALKVTILLVILLAAVLGTGFYYHDYLSRTAENIENHITVIEGATKEGNWQNAKSQLIIAKDQWDHTEKAWSMLINHMEIDNIDTALSRMEEFINTKDSAMALAEAATLKQYIKHIPDTEALKIKNIL